MLQLHPYKTTPRHCWTVTTRKRYPSTHYMPMPTMMDHGLWITTRKPISEAQAIAAARATLPEHIITSATPGRHQVTTRHQYGKHSRWSELYVSGYVQSVTA
jgi:hypothetical protein